MEFLAEHSINGKKLPCKQFNTDSVSFESDLFRYCNSTGNIAKDYLALEMAKKDNGKKYYEIQAFVEIELHISFSDINSNGFYGSCVCKLKCGLKPADPGLYDKQFFEINSQIRNQIISSYQNLFHF